MSKERLPIYDGFNNWEDVASNFAGGRWDYPYPSTEDALKQIPEPEQVLLAINKQESYEGSAWVVYRQGNAYYENHGGHCSCYGFEGQWNPECAGTAKEFLEQLDKRTGYECDDSEKYIPILKQMLNEDMTELIVGKFYKNPENGKKRKLIAIEGTKYIFYSEDDTIVFMKDADDVGLFVEWEEGATPVIWDRWFLLNTKSGFCDCYWSFDDAKLSESEDEFMYHLRYDSSKPLKERITVIEDVE